MSAFAQGFQLGGNMYNQAERNRLLQEQFELEKAREGRAAEKHGIEMAGLRRVDDATQALVNAQSLGLQVPGAQQNNEGLQRQSFRQFEIGQQNAAESGGEAPAYVAPTGLQPTYRPASRLDLNNLRMALADAKGDATAATALDDRGFKMQGDEDTRAFITRARQLYDGRTQSPEALAEWQKFAQPHTQMISGYKGIDLDARVNPKTGVIEAIPYEGDKLQPVAFEQALPYLLKSYQLTSQFGSPEAAVEALNKLSAEERARLMGDTNFRFGIADKSSQSINRANTAESSRITANASALSARSAADLRAEQLRGLQTLRQGREEALQVMEAFDKLTPEQQAGPEGQALVQRFNTINVKAGGTVGLQPKGGKSGPGSGLLSRGVEQKKNDDGTYTAFDKTTGQALYNTINGEPIPLGMDTSSYQGMKKAAQESGVKLARLEDNGRLVLRFEGADGQYYDDPAKAKYAKAPAAPGEAPAETPRASGLKLSPAAQARMDEQTRAGEDLVRPVRPTGVSRGNSTGTGGYTYRGVKFPTKAAAEAARAEYQKTGKLPNK